ncbi:unnamed protein product, partial [Rotaria magnacalcarata]
MYVVVTPWIHEVANKHQCREWREAISLYPVCQCEQIRTEILLFVTNVKLDLLENRSPGSKIDFSKVLLLDILGSRRIRVDLIIEPDRFRHSRFDQLPEDP